MASTIITKNNTTGAPGVSDLVQGEMALNVGNGKLFYGTAGGTAVSSSFTFTDLILDKTLNCGALVATGNTTLGDASTDTHTFTGNITASLNISASGVITSGFANIEKIYLPGQGIETMVIGSTFAVGRTLEVVGEISVTGNISASKYVNQIIPVIQNSSYYNGPTANSLLIGHGTYGFADRVWNKQYTPANMVSNFNSNANANCGVFVHHKLKNIKLIGTIKPSETSATVSFWLFKLPGYLSSSPAGNAPQPFFIASGSSDDTTGSSFHTVYITGSAAGGHGGFNPSVGVEAGDAIIVAAQTSNGSGNVKINYSVTGELDE